MALYISSSDEDSSFSAGVGTGVTRGVEDGGSLLPSIYSATYSGVSEINSTPGFPLKKPVVATDIMLIISTTPYKCDNKYTK